MPFRFERLAPALLVAVILVAACDNPLEPSDVAGIYVLERVQSDPLPAVVHGSWAGITTVLSDTIELNPDRTGVRHGWLNIVSDYVTEPGDIRFESSFTYRIDEGRVEISFSCPPNAMCLPPPHMVLLPIGWGMRLDFDGSFRTPAYYRRVARWGARDGIPGFRPAAVTSGATPGS